MRNEESGSEATVSSEKTTEGVIREALDGHASDMEGNVEGRFEDAEETCRRTKGGTSGGGTCQDFIRGECRRSRCKFKHPSRRERTREEAREMRKNAELGGRRMAERRWFTAKDKSGRGRTGKKERERSDDTTNEEAQGIRNHDSSYLTETEDTSRPNSERTEGAERRTNPSDTATRGGEREGGETRQENPSAMSTQQEGRDGRNGREDESRAEESTFIKCRPKLRRDGQDKQ